MNARTAHLGKPRTAPLWSLIRSELAPFPGRQAAVWRLLLSTALVIVISMALQVPFLSLSIIVVFFTAQENTVLTRLSGTLLVFGSTLGVALALVLIKLTIDFPMLRILGACLIAFCGMYFMRISKAGVIGFLIALLVFYFQTFVDLVDDPEGLVRALLWAWVAITYPIVLTVTVNFLLLPARPARLLTDEMCRQLDNVLAQLEARRTQSPIRLLSSNQVSRGVLTLHRHLIFATLGDDSYQHERARHLQSIAAIDRLHTAAAHLSQLPMLKLLPEQSHQVATLQAHCQALRSSLTDHTSFRCSECLGGATPANGELDSVLRDMKHALQAIAKAESIPNSPLTQTREPRISIDAFSNPVYGQFALKSVLAALLCYLFYTAVQWPGIHTAMLTCFILALPSLGASTHKGLTRIVGCTLGSLVALIATVFVIPHLDSITGLLLLTLPIVAVGAWVAAGSARSNYIGVQFVFAYALAQLGRFGPSTDLSEIRDRMIGILIGVAVSLVISAMIWPEREGQTLKTMLGRLLHGVAHLTRAGADCKEPAARSAAIDRARLQGWALLIQNCEMQARVALEPGWQHDHGSVSVDVTTWLAEAQETLFAANWLQVVLQHAGPGLPPTFADAFEAFRESAASRLELMANRFTGEGLVDQSAQLPHALAALNRCRADAGRDAPGGFDEILSAAKEFDQRLEQLENRLLPYDSKRK
ncbi:TPA: FUSC family protein [Pseudomonas putida]|uniref:FUSC family protein n=1 Tax=Pseudomonas putida TaxID=303 RepID=UPI00236364AA|nr:FUSC family protein [Pseudomonas putida]MDD2008322.1 FUSC family protein [Pseudomonas putida]HDS1775787.1 FUSC family protein [Pseudomonas putida]